jgi:hypothetical protein
MLELLELLELLVIERIEDTVNVRIFGISSATQIDITGKQKREESVSQGRTANHVQLLRRSALASAWLCPQCCRVFFERDVHQTMQKRLENVKKKY